MKQSLLQEKYPVFSLDLPKAETKYKDCDEIIAYLKARVDEHKIAKYIADFDHYAHTLALEDGVLEEGLIAARNLVFCFGIQLTKPEMLAVRPRSIGVAEYENHFVISFLEAPMPVANQAMETWAKALVS